MTEDSTQAEDLRVDMGTLLNAVLSRWLRIVIVTVLLVGATFAVLLFVPKMYESSASLLVEERDNVLTRTIAEQSTTQSIPVEAMMSSQIELIKSRDTLLTVIDSENLRSVPELTGAGFSPIRLILQLLGRSQEPKSLDEIVVQNLTDRLTVVQERDSAVISVLVRTTDPDLSARIANAIAKAPVRRRAGQSLSDTAEAAAWLGQEIDRLRVKVQEAETAVANYRIENDLYSGTDNTSILDQQLTNISNQITAAQERRSAAQSRADLILGLLEKGQPVDGVTDVRDSVVVQELNQSRATLEGELAQRSATLLSAHPTIKGLKAQIREVEQQIAQEARRVAEALRAQAEIEADVGASLRDDLARLKLSVSAATRDNVALAGLEREARAQRDLLESYLARYNEAVSQTDASSALPDVRVVTLAAPAVQPASPKTTLILAAVGFVVLALQIGGILFGELMSGRALTQRQAIEDSEGITPEELRVEAADVDAQPYDVADAADATFAAEVEGAAAEEDGDGPVGQPASPDQSLPEADVEAATSVEAQALDEDAAATAAADAPLPVAPGKPGFGSLVDDIVAGRVRVVALAALGGFRECLDVSDRLVADCLRGGLTVCCVDAGSCHTTEEPGLTDLSADRAGFGDVVHRVSEGLAEVRWGTLAVLERRSMKPATLLAALTDVYDVVVVNTGRIGLASALPVFAGVDFRLVLVGDEPEGAQLAAARDDAAALGYEVAQVVSAPRLRSEVA